MEAKTRKEFDVYEMKLIQWMNGDLAYALREGGGGWGFLARDMDEKFWEWMFPAIRRLYECGYCTNDEIKEFTAKMLVHIQNFKIAIESLDEEEDDE